MGWTARKLPVAKFRFRCKAGPPNDPKQPLRLLITPAALEAAHLGSKGGWRTNHTEGILLRRDLHALLDAGKLEIIDGVVSVASEHYQQFNGVRVW